KVHEELNDDKGNDDQEYDHQTRSCNKEQVHDLYSFRLILIFRGADNYACPFDMNDFHFSAAFNERPFGNSINALIPVTDDSGRSKSCFCISLFTNKI